MIPMMKSSKCDYQGTKRISTIMPVVIIRSTFMKSSLNSTSVSIAIKLSLKLTLSITFNAERRHKSTRVRNSRSTGERINRNSKKSVFQF